MHCVSNCAVWGGDFPVSEREAQADFLQGSQLQIPRLSMSKLSSKALLAALANAGLNAATRSCAELLCTSGRSKAFRREQGLAEFYYRAFHDIIGPRGPCSSIRRSRRMAATTSRTMRSCLRRPEAAQ